ncbi:uncharacterized protein THITE_2109515 [Thermothielavioides terrestris NRRL 8126]|uniref:Cell wall mannoprotein PIR1-like C-terminal domain-containing protein n=1 Tax=Thermothielavioides terrestris (strain ATCC 38088 / NRRL 8126) TaxID=578455 RepID=G2QWC0_THETT|nr:uncharacterized protein THITE_2109515 [Thermothielavioides terrestris NRRL 8126]AEO63895.1 hypothetical protein THITE_2109515 [Thermothielavioides terrestris NRRL 8126]
MRIQVFALLAAAAAAIAQGVTDKIPPKGAAPDGCKASLDGKFEITVVELNKLNNKVKKDHAIQTRGNCGGDGTLVLQLADTVLTDNHNRTGYIASNFQFQFDNPPQAGALYTAGFSYCTNGSLALGSTTVFYRCLSGNFYNLYDRWWAAQCDPVEIIVMPCGGEAGQTGGNNPSQTVVGTQVITTTIVSPLSDGQPQVIVTTIPVPICQIGDGESSFPFFQAL